METIFGCSLSSSTNKLKLNGTHIQYRSPQTFNVRKAQLWSITLIRAESWSHNLSPTDWPLSLACLEFWCSDSLCRGDETKLSFFGLRPSYDLSTANRPRLEWLSLWSMQGQKRTRHRWLVLCVCFSHYLRDFLALKHSQIHSCSILYYSNSQVTTGFRKWHMHQLFSISA